MNIRFTVVPGEDYQGMEHVHADWPVVPRVGEKVSLIHANRDDGQTARRYYVWDVVYNTHPVLVHGMLFGQTATAGPLLVEVEVRPTRREDEP